MTRASTIEKRVARLEAKLGIGPVAHECSFCGRPRRQAKIMVAGPAVFICGECVELCVSVYVSNVGDVEAAIGRLCTEIDAGVAARRASEVG